MPKLNKTLFTFKAFHIYQSPLQQTFLRTIKQEHVILSLFRGRQSYGAASDEHLGSL